MAKKELKLIREKNKENTFILSKDNDSLITNPEFTAGFTIIPDRIETVRTKLNFSAYNRVYRKKNCEILREEKKDGMFVFVDGEMHCKISKEYFDWLIDMLKSIYPGHEAGFLEEIFLADDKDMMFMIKYENFLGFIAPRIEVDEDD